MMKNLLLLLALLLFCSQSIHAQSSEWTPAERCDTYGYCMKTDTSRVDPVAFNWITIPNPTRIDNNRLGDDAFVGPVDMNIRFRYYLEYV
jgi:hypothetical protein